MVEIKQGEVFPVHAMREMRGRRGTAPVILNGGGKWICVVNITPPVALIPEKNSGKR